MDILKLYLKLSKVVEKSKGFTLIELLVAIAMSGIVLTGLGTGMMALLNSSNTSAKKADIKNQLNRAADYINEDVKRSRFAAIKTTTTTNDTVILTYFVNASDTTSNTIEYMMSTASNPWLGPNVIRRRVNGGTWQVLVDSLTDNSVTLPSCSGTKTNYTTGFFACVTKATSNRAVDVYQVNVSLFGEVSDRTTINVDTKTIARSVSPSLTPPTLRLSSDSDPTPDVLWDTVSGVTSYKIYRCSATGSSCTPTTSSTLVYNGSGTVFNETSNTAVNSKWCYAGASSDGVYTSSLGNVICAAVSTGGLPGGISDLNATDALQPVVTWSAATDATSYSLYSCSTATTCNPITSGTLILGPTTNRTYSQTTDPTSGQKWCYQVRTTNSYGTSDSNIDCGLLNSSATPNAPTLTLDTTNTNIISWTDQAASGATTYALYQCQATGTNTCTPNSIFTGFPQFTTTATQLLPATVGNRYCYNVKAINTTPDPDRESALSNTACGSIALAAPPFTNLPWTTQTTPTRPTINWSTVASATSYELYRCSTSSTSTACDPSTGTWVTGAGYTSTTYTESTEPPNNQRYCYAVRSKNTGGVSSFSAASCGAVRIAQCVVPNVLGANTNTPAQRDNVITAITTTAGFVTPTIQSTSGSPARVLSVQYNNSGTMTNATSLTLPCSTVLTISWTQ